MIQEFEVLLEAGAALSKKHGRFALFISRLESQFELQTYSLTPLHGHSELYSTVFSVLTVASPARSLRSSVIPCPHIGRQSVDSFDLNVLVIGNRHLRRREIDNRPRRGLSVEIQMCNSTAVALNFK